MNNKDITKKILALALASAIPLAGCAEQMGSDTSEYDVLNTNTSEETENLLNGIEQILDVIGEDFKLKVNYTSNEKEWRITSDKELNTEIKTVGLSPNLEVYIDNVHTDTSIISTKAALDGIKQDTMDDRIHNSQMLGFPINDNVSYYGINEIEGENKDFIDGYFFGLNAYQIGDVEQKRYLESDFLDNGVWANRIDSIIDLIIIDNNTNEVRTVSVSSTVLVEVNNKIEYLNGSIREYEKDGTYRKKNKSR